MFLPEIGTVATSLLEILSYRAQYQSDLQAYIFLQDGEAESEMFTYGELDSRAKAIAAHLQSWEGERALLLYHSGLEFVSAFFGCLYAGVVAVPVYPPTKNQKLSRLLSVVNDAQIKVALTSSSILTDIEKRFEDKSELIQLKLVTTDNIRASHQNFVPKPLTPESLAFLQYTSGSTGTPKGVMVTHANIMHNQLLIMHAFEHSEKTSIVSWLPLFHDMGLIGSILQPMYLGVLSILMPPVAFLQKPIRWLQAISKYKATTSGGPNFAYDLCVKKIHTQELASINLSSWNVAFNGAEPVKAETLKQFSKTFAECGFNYNAFYPCYGMAESTLFTTGMKKYQKPIVKGFSARDLRQNLAVESGVSSQESRLLVGCGRSYLDSKVIIVNPDSLTYCQKGQVGEIWLSGGSIASGYWNFHEAIQETFRAYLKDSGEGPFLRTGDLGFFCNDELFVTGRLKDLIIIRGRNHYPQDIELSVEKSHRALKTNSGSAFSIEVEGEEKLIVLHEVERTHLRQLNSDEVIEAINQAVSLEHELMIHTIVLLKPGNIPQTSSGKIQRSTCRQKFIDGSLQNVIFAKQQALYSRIHEEPFRCQVSKLEPRINLNCEGNENSSEITENKSPKSLSRNSVTYNVCSIQELIISRLAKKLDMQVDRVIETNATFISYGIDSVMAVELVQDLEDCLGHALDPTLLWNFPTIESLSQHLIKFLERNQKFGEEENGILQKNSLEKKDWSEGEI